MYSIQILKKGITYVNQAQSFHKCLNCILLKPIHTIICYSTILYPKHPYTQFNRTYKLLQPQPRQALHFLAFSAFRNVSQYRTTAAAWGF